MKKIFQTYADYNKKANLALLNRFGKLSKEQLMQVRGAYYNSIFEAFKHILINSDTLFLKLFSGLFPGDQSLAGNRLAGLDEEKYGALMEELEQDYNRLFDYRRETDGLICRFIDQLSPEQFVSNVPLYRDEDGQTISGELWKTILKLFDHQTYHRGQISAFLDRIGIENDSFSAGWENK